MTNNHQDFTHQEQPAILNQSYFIPPVNKFNNYYFQFYYNLNYQPYDPNIAAMNYFYNEHLVNAFAFNNSSVSPVLLRP
jgi:hypothetical protein